MQQETLQKLGMDPEMAEGREEFRFDQSLEKQRQGSVEATRHSAGRCDLVATRWIEKGVWVGQEAQGEGRRREA